MKAINVAIGTGSTSFFSTSKYYMRADVNGTPSTILETFTASTVSSGIARFVGSKSVTVGSKFWITPGQPFSVLAGCYGQPLSNSDLVNDGSMNVDSTTGLSSVYYTESSNGGVTWGVGTLNNFLFQLGIEIGGDDSSTVSINSISPNHNPLIYRTTYTLNTQLSTPGRVTFFAGSKVIAGCKNLRASSTTATCNWRPSVHGNVQVYATLVPTDSSIPASKSDIKSYSIVTRTGTR